jgi:hypothetical protein
VSRGSYFLSPCDSYGSDMSSRQGVPQRATTAGATMADATVAGVTLAGAVQHCADDAQVIAAITMAGESGGWGEVKGGMTSCQPHKRQLAGYASCPTETRLLPATTTHSSTLLPSLPVYMPSTGCTCPQAMTSHIRGAVSALAGRFSCHPTSCL